MHFSKRFGLQAKSKEYLIIDIIINFTASKSAERGNEFDFPDCIPMIEKIYVNVDFKQLKGLQFYLNLN